MALIVHPDGELHAVTVDNGIFLLKWTGDSLRVLGTYHDATSTDAFLDAAGDGLGHIWIGTTSGIVRFDARDGSFLRVGAEEGLPMQSVEMVCADRAHDILARGSKFVRFDPKSLSLATSVSGLYIRAVTVNGSRTGPSAAIQHKRHCN